MMRHFLVLSICFCLAAFAAWIPPSTELTPGVVIHPNPITASRWLWFEADSVMPDTDCFYRSSLAIGDDVDSLELTCYFDDNGELYLNGVQLEKDRTFQQNVFPMKAYNFKVPRERLQSKNTLAIHVRNGKYSGGLFLLGKKYRKDGGIEYFHSSPSEWKAAPKAQVRDGWNQAEYDDSTWMNAKDFGDAGTLPWISETDVLNLCSTPNEKKQYARELEEATRLPDSLKDEPDHQMTTVWKNGLPFWKVGNEEFPPAIMRTSNLLDSKYKNDMLAKMALAGGARVVEFAISTRYAERGNGVYDFSKIDIQARRLLKLAPNAYIMMHFYVESLDSWLAKHPDEGIGYPTGPADNLITSAWSSMVVGGRAIRPSYASQPFLDELDNFTRQFAEHVKQFPWFKRVVALRTSYGCYSEWHYYGMAGQMPDTGKAMTGAFRRYLRDKYATEAALKAAWHDDQVTFDSATVPGVEERMGSEIFLRNPATAEMKVLDYYECMQEVIGEALLSLAGSAKKYMPKLQVGAFFGYVFGMGQFPSEGQTLALEKVLASPNIDFLSAPYSYRPWARNMGGNGMVRILPEPFLRHGKLGINELDIRTHLSRKEDHYHDVTTANQSAQIFLRDIFISALSGIGLQFNEMRGSVTPSWFNAPEIFSAVHHALEAWKEIRDHAEPTVNDIAVIFDYRELYRNGYPLAKMQTFNYTIGDLSLNALLMSGYGFDLYSMQGFLLSQKKYRTLVFMNASSLNQSERERLAAIARRHGTTTIWIYAPGLASEQGFSRDAMHELTGIKLDFSTEKQPMAMTLDSGKKLGNPKLNEAPRIWVTDNDSTSLATYSNGNVAMAKKHLTGDVTAIFSGVPITDEQIWASIFQGAGNQSISRPGVFTKYSKPFLLVHVGKAGEYDITLPDTQSKAMNVLDNQAIPVQDGKILLSCDDCKTWLLKLTK